MPHPEPRIQCSNPHCTADNTLEELFCHRCSTPTVKRYLWSTKAVNLDEREKTSTSSRYLALSPQIFLDTQPRKAPATPEEVPAEIIAYLQLFPCYPHVPQVYGLLDGSDAWLLDYGTVPIDSSTGKLKYPNQLIPKFQTLWNDANAFQQLNWLWQMAKLWKPLSSKKVASTLLHPEVIRINGQVVQFIELQQDLDYQPSLRNLGSMWQDWAHKANPQIQDFIEQLGSHLETGTVDDIRQIIVLLDKAIAQCRKTRQYSYQVYALTDSGPNRSNNEDAAYPINVDSQNTFTLEQSLAIVCDGVGGHDGGEIASGETINYLKNKIAQLSLEKLTPGNILSKLTKYINSSNDIISQRNDSEQRQERQRMGTTLVMTLASAHEMYLAHVGDSRIYWITSDSCHQVTTDDDLASREVRLGYAVYRDSLQYPSAGALIQAIGMRDSASLHPNLQRYMIEDDCIFLLCTDGLSDFDRVEQYWRKEIAPVLDGKHNLAQAVSNLIEIANRDNGHDNVTVALVHCQVNDRPNVAEAVVKWSEIEATLQEPNIWEDPLIVGSFPDSIAPDDTPPEDTKIPSTPIIDDENERQPVKKQPKWLKPLIFGLIISTVIFSVYYFVLRNQLNNPDDELSPSQETNSQVDL